MLFSIVASSPQPAGVTVSLDKGDGETYFSGEDATVCYGVDRPVDIRLSLCPEGTSCQTILEGYDDGRGDCLIMTLNYPAGRYDLRIEAEESGQVIAQDLTSFVVSDLSTATLSITPTPTGTPTLTATPTRRAALAPTPAATATALLPLTAKPTAAPVPATDHPVLPPGRPCGSAGLAIGAFLFAGYIRSRRKSHE